MNSLPISYRFKEIRNLICQRIESISSKSAAALLGACMIGERELLSGQVELDFQRIGISHILALSGMHLSMLIGFVELILKHLKFGKRFRIIIECIFTVIYMALTGFPLSVCRAGLMFIISALLYLLSGNKDSITSLFIAGGIIIIASPYSCLDIGLWLSILATLGILISSELINDKYNEEKGVKKFLRSLLTSVIFSLFAVASTAAISSMSFSQFSVISIVSTLIFSILIEIYIYYGIIVLIFGKVLPLGILLQAIESIITSLASKISDMPFIVASTSFIGVKVVYIGLAIVFSIFAILNIKRKKLFVFSIAAVFMLTSVLSVAITEFSKHKDSIISSCDTSDKIIIKSEGNTTLFDASSHMKSEAYDSVSVLTSEGIVELDSYLVANYTGYISESLPILLSNILIKEVKLPIPCTLDEEEIVVDIFAKLSDYRCEISFYDHEEIISIGNVDIAFPYQNSNKNALAATFKTDKGICAYLSSGILEVIPQSRELLYVSNSLIFGAWGNSDTSPVLIDEFGNNVEKIIIYDKDIYIGDISSDAGFPEIYFYKDSVNIYN